MAFIAALVVADQHRRDVEYYHDLLEQGVEEDEARDQAFGPPLTDADFTFLLCALMVLLAGLVALILIFTLL